MVLFRFHSVLAQHCSCIITVLIGHLDVRIFCASTKHMKYLCKKLFSLYTV